MQQYRVNKIEYKTEHSLWLMMKAGNKNWDARLWDMGDDRIHAMATGHRGDNGRWKSEVELVVFIDKETGEELTMELEDIILEPWSPGWGFMKLRDPSKNLPC